METIRYANGEVRAISKDVEDTRTVEFVISTADKDRHSTVLNPNKWKLDNYNRNPIVGYQHNLYGDMCTKPDPDDVIGSSKVWVEGEKLIGAVTFEPAEENELAEKIFRKVLRKTLRSASVGFMPLPDKKGVEGVYGKEDAGEHEGGPNETYYYKGQELVEWSIVNIPSNPKAQKKALRTQTANALMFLKRELGFTFADIERLKVSEVVEMLETGKRELPEDDITITGKLDGTKMYTGTTGTYNIPDLTEQIREALGDEYNEKLTLKGLFAILRGGEAEQIEGEDAGGTISIAGGDIHLAFDGEARDKHIKYVQAKQNYYKLIHELK